MAKIRDLPQAPEVIADTIFEVTTSPGFSPTSNKATASQVASYVGNALDIDGISPSANAYTDTEVAALGNVVQRRAEAKGLRFTTNTADQVRGQKLNLTGDVDVRVLVEWPTSVASLAELVGDRAGGSGEMTLRVNSNGTLNFLWWESGMPVQYNNSTPSAVPGERVWVRATRENNVDGVSRVRFYRSTDGVNWLLQSTALGGAPASPTPAFTPLTVGGSTVAPNVVIYRAQVRNGVDGPVVADWRADAHFAGNNRSVDSAGNVWTIRGSGWSWDTGGALAPGPQAGTWHGNGFPEGVVTAPVGTRYIDLDATNGAVEWIKATGTGNTGWRVVYGDTGWRNVTELIGPDWEIYVSGGLYCRRVNGTVFWRLLNLTLKNTTDGNPTNRVVVQRSALPAGFQIPGEDPLWFAHGAQIPRLVNTSAIGAYFTWAPDLLVTYTGGSSTSAYFTTGFRTYAPNAWPTTLPGVAA